MRKYVPFFDYLNITACIAVVYLHCNNMVHTFATGWNWILALSIECIFYFAVPIFFMLSGATLIEYRSRYDTKTFVIKRLTKTLIPFLFWSLFWLFMQSWYFDQPLPGLRTAISEILSTQIVSAYWFFIPLFGLYLSMPLLSLLKGRAKIIDYLIVSSFILTSVIPVICRFVGITWNDSLAVSSASSYILYALLGYRLSTVQLTSSQSKKIYLLGFLGLLIRFLYSLISSELKHEVDRTLFDYLAFTSVFYSAAVFVWFKNHNRNAIGGKFTSLIKSMSSCSFGIYLLHQPILNMLIFDFLGVQQQSITFRLFGALVFYIILLIIVYILKKIPIVNRLIP